MATVQKASNNTASVEFDRVRQNFLYFYTKFKVLNDII